MKKKKKNKDVVNIIEGERGRWRRKLPFCQYVPQQLMMAKKHNRLFFKKKIIYQIISIIDMNLS